MNRQTGLTAAVEAWRRRRAVELFREGWRQTAIAKALGVTSGAVSQWVKAEREGGPQAIETRRHRTGRRPKLSEEQKQRLLALLSAGTEASGQVGERGQRWTGKRICSLIRQEFGVSYLPTSLPKLLRDLGWSPQVPEVKASQRDAEAIEAFRQEWTGIKRGQSESAAGSSG